MRRVLLAAGFAALAAVQVACGDGGAEATRTATARSTTSASVPSTAGCSSEVRRGVQYRTPPGDPPAQTTLDVYPAPDTSATPPGPIVVWVHGGGWSFGNKSSVGTKDDLFGDLGAAVVSVNYRLAPRADGEPGAHHPTQAEDVAAAVAWASEHAASFGADPDRVVLVGHSAGGHLVSLLGTDPRYLRDAGLADGELRCVVSLDTEGYDLAEKVSQGGLSASLIRNAFGDDPAVWHDASPISHVADEAGAVRVLAVTRGTKRRQREASQFVDALRDAGGDARLVRAPGYSHDEVGRLLGAPAESVVTTPVRGFVEDCAGTSS